MPVVVDRGVHSVRIEAQVVGAAATAANRGPVEAAEACAVQDVAWIDAAAPDKHQRRPLAEVWVMRLEKLPFNVVLLVGRVKPFKSIKSIVGEWDFGWMEFFEERELRDNQVM